MNDINYSTAMRFASQMFKYLNGKVNYVVPASCLLFGNNSMGDGCFGDMSLDIVEINIPGIFKVYGYDTDTIKGFIIYSIIHELLHLDQDIRAYERICNDNIETMTRLIEQSCHAMTLKIFEDSFFSLSHDWDQNDFILPTTEVFMNIPRTDHTQYDSWLNSYYRVPSYEEKAIHTLCSYLEIDFEQSVLGGNCSNSILEVNMNGNTIGYQYIYYLNHWMPVNIFNLLRPIGYILKAYPSHPLDVDVDAYTFVSNENERYKMNKFVANISTDLTLDVIHNMI